MNRLTRKEQLKIILNKLKEHKRQGGKDGIDEKIQEIERTEKMLIMTLKINLK